MSQWSDLIQIARLRAEKRIIVYTIFLFIALGLIIKVLYSDYNTVSIENGRIYKELYKECVEKQNTCEGQRRKFELENMRLMIENTRLLRFEKDSLNKLTKLNNRIIKTQ